MAETLTLDFPRNPAATGESRIAADDALLAFDPSERFVLHCLAGDAAAARARLAEGIDFEIAVRFAFLHEVVGELAAFAESAALDLPEEILAGLAHQSALLTAQRERVRQETLRLAEHLEVAGIDVVFAKGAVAAALYRAPGTARTVKDLDVYVRVSDLEAVFANLPPDYEIDPMDEVSGALIARQHHTSAWASEAELAVEIHWAVAAPRHALRFDLAGAIERASAIDLGEDFVPTLRGDDALIFWAIELSKDSWSCGKKILDFARAAARADEAMMEAAFAGARAQGSLRMLRVGLLVAHSLNLVHLTPAVLDRASGDRTARQLAAVCLRRLARGGPPARLLGRAAEGLALARKHDSLANQLRHVWNIIVVHRARVWLEREDEAEAA